MALVMPAVGCEPEKSSEEFKKEKKKSK